MIEHCPTCGHVMSPRIISLYEGMVKSLWEVYKWCEEKERHEFQTKEVRHLLGRNEYARFGDWVMFGGLVYKQGKAHYGLNMDRCREFFSGQREIPVEVMKDPLTREITQIRHAKVNEIPSLIEFLDENRLYIPEYKEQANLL